MSKENEIKEQVKACYERLESLVDPTTFALKTGADEIWDEIANLQNQCNHEYVDGVCKYCNKEEV